MNRDQIDRSPDRSSGREHARFVSIDGPSSSGTTAVIRHLAQILTARGEDVQVTAEPSDGPIGKLASELSETVTGHARACLYAADRYHQIKTTVLPHLKTGHIVIFDRYLTSSLVSQRFGGVDPIFLWQLNEEAERPDLTVILDADAPDSNHIEDEGYRQATDRLIEAGFDVLRIGCDSQTPEQSAVLICDQLVADEPTEVDP